MKIEKSVKTKYRSRCELLENRPLEEGRCEHRQTDFRLIIACTNSVALLFATEGANEESGLRKANDRSPTSTRICCSELYKMKLLLVEMTSQKKKKAPDKESFPARVTKKGMNEDRND
jgi:hypothetical protein